MENPSEAAKEAGLVYVTDGSPGIRRVARARQFSYVLPSGKPLKDAAELGRIRALAVPPAYTDVWICPQPDGHLQATGRDARGRKQYRYHPRWREIRDETKYHRMLDFARALPRIRERVETDIALPGLQRDKVLAAVVLLLESTRIRIGNDEYAKENDSYGLTTLLNRHARVAGSEVRFSFKGKSGVKHAVSLRDRRLAAIVRACQDLPGQELFGYSDKEGTVRDVSSSDINDYIRRISGGDFTAKDFRTWVGTVQCALILANVEDAETQMARKREIAEACKLVAAHLGNTPAVCRRSYIHPGILEKFAADGSLGKRTGGKITQGLRPEEHFVVAFLKRHLPI
ncbi:MAG: DNA topoisomerase IB [Candidatus Eremiobacteraeota bacterium]|nr:DNA topoisomerase IB [Candidatus Eremiobacteraeota bacterium]